MTIVGPACHAGQIGAEPVRLQVVALYTHGAGFNARLFYFTSPLHVPALLI